MAEGAFRRDVAAGSSTSSVGSALASPLRARRDGWTAARRDSFIAAYEGGATVTTAAALAGMSRESAYRLRANPRAAAFAAAWAAVDTAERSRPTLTELLDDPAYSFAADARRERVLAEIARRPDFNRWLIRRIGVLRKSTAKA